MTTALVSGVLIVVSASLSAYITQRYTRRNADHAARREYEYKAKTAVVEQMQPLLFELAERCEDGYQRLTGIVKSAQSGRLDAGNPNRRFRADSQYYLPSTIYRLMAPLVAVRMCEAEIGRLDLTLAPAISYQYCLAKKLYRAWNSGAALARCGDPTPYDPDGPQRLRQHIRLGAIDQVVDLLTSTADARTRCLRYGEFQQLYNAHAKTTRQHPDALDRLKRLLTDFHPREKPVLWRIMLTQAVLYHAIGKAFADANAFQMSRPSFDRLDAKAQKDLDWTTPDGPRPLDPPAAAFEAVRTFLGLPQLEPRRDGSTPEANAQS